MLTALITEPFRASALLSPPPITGLKLTEGRVWGGGQGPGTWVTAAVPRPRRWLVASDTHCLRIGWPGQCSPQGQSAHTGWSGCQTPNSQPTQTWPRDPRTPRLTTLRQGVGTRPGEVTRTDTLRTAAEAEAGDRPLAGFNLAASKSVPSFHSKKLHFTFKILFLKCISSGHAQKTGHSGHQPQSSSQNHLVRLPSPTPHAQPDGLGEVPRAVGVGPQPPPCLLTLS